MSAMQEIPNVPTMSKAEIIQQQLNEISELKKQVVEKRRALRLLGSDTTNDEPKTVQSPVQPPVPVRRAGRPPKGAATVTVIPAESPFFDPHATVKVPDVKVPDVKVAEVKVPEVTVKPAPEVKFVLSAPPPPKQTATKQAQVKTNRVSHDGLWF